MQIHAESPPVLLEHRAVLSVTEAYVLVLLATMGIHMYFVHQLVVLKRTIAQLRKLVLMVVVLIHARTETHVAKKQNVRLQPVALYAHVLKVFKVILL